MAWITRKLRHLQFVADLSPQRMCPKSTRLTTRHAATEVMEIEGRLRMRGVARSLIAGPGAAWRPSRFGHVTVSSRRSRHCCCCCCWWCWSCSVFMMMIALVAPSMATRWQAIISTLVLLRLGAWSLADRRRIRRLTPHRFRQLLIASWNWRRSIQLLHSPMAFIITSSLWNVHSLIDSINTHRRHYRPILISCRISV